MYSFFSILIRQKHESMVGRLRQYPIGADKAVQIRQAVFLIARILSTKKQNIQNNQNIRSCLGFKHCEISNIALRYMDKQA